MPCVFLPRIYHFSNYLPCFERETICIEMSENSRNSWRRLRINTKFHIISFKIFLMGYPQNAHLADDFLNNF